MKQTMFNFIPTLGLIGAFSSHSEVFGRPRTRSRPQRARRKTMSLTFQRFITTGPHFKRMSITSISTSLK